MDSWVNIPDHYLENIYFIKIFLKQTIKRIIKKILVKILGHGQLII